MAIKPKLCMIPSGVGTDTLYSVLPADGTGDFTFDRNLNTATRVNKDGLIETVGADIPRLNYPLIDGVVSGCPSLLLEPTRSNNLQRSQEFDNSVWGKDASVTITPNYSISPDGTQNAERFQKTSTGGNEGITQNIFGLSAGTYTLTFYIKSNTDANQNARLLYGGFQSSSILITPNWQRFEITYTANTSVDYNGILSNEALDISIWGAQLEAGSYATSYIPTSGSQATRSAETCNNAGDVNTFNDSEGVLMVEISALADDLTNRIISLSDGTNNNIISVQFANTQSNDIIAYYNNPSQTGRLLSTTSYNIKSFNKIALVWSNSYFNLYINGYLIGSSTIENPFSNGTLNELKFEYGNGTLPFYGNTKQLQYFDTALTDTDLEELTSWSSFNEMANAQLYTII